MKMNARHKKPSALCSDQLNLRRFAFQSMVKLRRHLSIPGHQMTVPEKHIRVTQAPPTPLARWPVPPDSRLSWRSTSQSTIRNPTSSESPTSPPIHQLKHPPTSF